MQLTGRAMEKIIHNVLSHDFDETGGLHLWRFSESQRRFYAADSEGYRIKSNSSASVTFDFVTDSDYIAVKFDLHRGSSHDWAGFDLHVDGIFCDSRHFGNLEEKEVSFTLPRGEHRITLYFPWSAETVVNEVHLTDGADVRAVKKRAKVLALGDSITQGYVAKFPSLTYASQLSGSLDLEIVNQGIGGFCFNENAIDDTIVFYRPDLIMIAYGTNDYTRYNLAEDFRMNVSKYMEKLVGLFPDTRMLALLPLYRNDLKCREKQKFCEYTLDDAREILLSIYRKYKNVDVLKETCMPRVPEAYVSDYLHPCELGFTFVAKAMEKRVKELLAL